MNTVTEIEKVRASNNHLWISLLQIALDHAPEETKIVLKQINENDQKISAMMTDLIYTPHQD